MNSLRASIPVLALVVLTIPGCSFFCQLCRDPEPRWGSDWTPTSPTDREIMLSPCDSVPPEPHIVPDLTGGTTYENEVHDCQRLVYRMHENLHFGPLVGVFPLDSAMTVVDDAFDGTDGLAIATIYNWGSSDDGPDDALVFKLQPGWHCLWLRQYESEWQGAIVPADTVSCASESADPPHASEWNLDVRRTGAHSADGVPPTARWGWDHAASTHYIGIKCGSLWCAIGPTVDFSTFEPASDITPPMAMGLYDEQFLAVDPDDDGRMTPGPWAIILPSDSLGDLAHADVNTVVNAFQGQVPVATIRLSGWSDASVEPYLDKFNLRKENSSTYTVDLLLTFGSGRRAFFDNGEGQPEMTGTVPYMPVVRHAAPGAVRWRWHDTDETAWVSCVSGCCDVQPDF